MFLPGLLWEWGVFENDVLQGSPLSCTLFIMATNGTLKALRRVGKCLSVDDLAFFY